MPDDLYWNDALAWSEQQAALLERRANGESVDTGIDREHVVEEVRDVGLSELRAVESLLRRGIEQLMKLRAWPDAQPAGHWSAAALNCLFDAQRACSAAMRGRVDLALCYRKAATIVLRMVIDRNAELALPVCCPFTLEELLPPIAVAPDTDALVAKLSS